MNKIKKVVGSIREYIRGYFSGGVFMKSVSLMVAACFIINIANLPAIASESSIYEKQKKQQEMKEEKGGTSVSYVADESRGSVSYMQNLSENIEIKEGVIYGDKGNGKKEPVGFWDGKKALIADGEGKLKENKAYTEAVNKKLGITEKAGEAEKKEAVGVGAITEENKSETAEKGTEEYNKVVDELVKQTGLSKEEIEKQLEGVEKSKLDEAIGLLSDFFANGGEIVNCAADALSEVLDMSTKGLLAFQALLVDISTGVFADNNKDLINAGQTQLMTSMDAMNEVLHSYGKESVGYDVSLDDFMAGLESGESGIVWVNEDHYITVTKTEEGNYSVADSNVNDGKAVEYTAEGFKTAMSGGEAKDKDGKEVLDKNGEKVTYNAVDETGKLKVLTESKGVGKQESAKELTREEMKEISGAKYVTQTQTGTRTESRVGTRTETRTGTRSETRTGTSTYTDENGVSHSSTYTYSVEVEYQYEVEVQYTYEVEVEYTYEVQVWVEDEEDDKAKEERKAKEEEERLAKEAEEKAYQEALKKAEEEAKAAFAKLAEDEAKFKEEMEKGKIKETEEDKKANEAAEKKEEEKYQSMTNEEFEKTVSETEGMKVTGMKVTGIDEGSEINGGYTFGEATFMAALNEALKATVNAFGNIKDYATALMGSITDTAVNILEGAVSGIKEFAYNMLGIGTGQKEGIVIDEESGTVTQYNANGSKTQVNIDANNVTYDDIKKQIDEQGFDKTVNWLKANNGFASMTAYDTKGKEIYTATRVGYSTVSGKEMAIEYSFAQDYSDQVYFSDAKKGESKVVTEKYGSDGQPASAMVYSSGSGSKTSQTTGSGLRFEANITALDKTVEWSTGKDETTGETYRVAKTVDFVGGENGKASGFEEAKIDSKGNVSVTRYDVSDAYYTEKQEGSESGSSSGASESSIVDEYKKILENANGLKIQGSSELYSGYEYVDNSWIDMSKMNTYTYSSASPNVVNKQSVDENGRSVVVTAEFKGEDWRYNRQVVSKSNLNTVTYSEETESGGTKVTIYNAGVELDNDLKYSDSQISGANKTWMEYDKDNNLVSGGVDYKANSEMAVVFGGSLSGDTIIIDEAVSYEFKVGADGKLELVSGSGLEGITGTYINRIDGEEVARGELSDGKIELGESGQVGISGKVTIDSGDKFQIEKGESSGEDESGSSAAIPDASDTNAKVTESEEGYTVSDGTISLRSGSLVVMGKGAVFKTGSELSSIGKVTEGNLKIADITEDGYDFVAESGECKVRQVSEDGVITVDTRYDTSGMMRRWTSNSSTGATLLEEFGRDSGGNLITTSTKLTATKEGDTGFGYTVDKLGTDGTATLKITDSEVYCTAGAEIYRLFAENANGDKIGLLYKGNSDNVGETQYQLRQTGGNTNLFTSDGETFYGQQNGNLIEIKYAQMDEEGNPVTAGEYFTISNAEGFEFNSETNSYTKTERTENKLNYTTISLNDSGAIKSVVTELKEFKLESSGTWYDAKDVVSLPGGGTLVLGQTEGYSFYCTINDEGNFVQIKEGMQVGYFTVHGADGQAWSLTTNNNISILNENGLTGTLTGTFSLTNDSSGFILKTTNNQDIKYTNPDGTTTEVTLKTGSKIDLYGSGCAITDGIISMSYYNTITIPPATSTGGDTGSGEDTVMPDGTGTNAKIVEQEDGGYKVSNGDLKITDGNFIIMGTNATFKYGSVISGQKVTSGSIKIATFDDNNQPVFVAASGTAYTYNSTSKLNMKYDSNGVSSAWINTYLSGKSVDGVSGATWNSGSIYRTYFKVASVTIDGKKTNYNTLATGSDGNLVIKSSGYVNASYTQTLSGSVSGVSGATWTSGSKLTVKLASDGSVSSTSYINASYTQTLSGSVEGLSGATWKSGSKVKISLASDGSVSGTSYINAAYTQTLSGSVEGLSGATWKAGSKVEVTLNSDGSAKSTSYVNAAYTQTLSGSVDGLSGATWRTGSKVEVTLNSDGTAKSTSYTNAAYTQTLSGSVDGLPGATWHSGSKLVVELNSDGTTKSTSYTGGYTQTLSGSVEGLSGASWKSGSTVEVYLNSDGTTKSVDYSNAKYSTEQVKTLTVPEPAISGEYYDDHGWGHQTSGFTMTYYQFDSNGNQVEIQVKVASDEQSWVIGTSSSTDLEVWVDGKKISTDSSSNTGWFTWSGDADSTYEFAQNYANGVLEENEYHFTDTYTVTVQNNQEAGTVATTAVLNLDDEGVQQQLGFDKLSYEVVVNPSNLINGQAEIKSVTMSGIDTIQIQTSSTNLAPVNSVVNSIQFNYADGAVSQVSQYESEMYISEDNVIQYKNVLGGITTDVNTGLSISVLDSTSPVQTKYVKDTYVETVGEYISQEGVDLSNCTITKTDVNGESHELQLYYGETEGSNGEKVLYYDLAEQNRQETVIDKPSTTTSYGGYSYESMTMEEALAAQGYVKGVDYDSYEIINRSAESRGYLTDQVKLIKEDTLSDGEIVWSSDFEGNGERTYSIDSIIFNEDNGSFTTTAGLILNNEGFSVTGSIEVPEASGEGSSNAEEPEKIEETLHNVSVSINGEELTLKATEEGDTSSKVAITFGAEKTFTDGTLGSNDYSFSHFYAGTDLTFYEASNLQSVDNNTTELENATEDAGDITSQTITVAVDSGSTVHLSTDTTLTQLASTVAEDGLKTGNATVTNTITFDPTDAAKPVETVKMVANLSGGQAWEDVSKTYEVSVDEGKTFAAVNDGDSLLGGSFNESKGIVDYGWWDGKVDLNANVTNYEIDKNGFVRAVETVGGFLGSIVGVVVDPVVQITTDIVNGNFTLNSLKNLYAGGLVGGLTDGIASAINGDGFGAGWNKHFSNNVILNWSASMMLNKTYDDVVNDGDAGKAATMGFVAVAAIAVTVLTGGMGAAAFVPALGGMGATAVLSGAALAGATATALGTASLVASALVTSYLVGTSVFNASVAFENGDWKTGVLNIAAAVLTMAFPVRIGGAPANAAASAVSNTGSTTIKLTGLSGRLSYLGTSVAQGFTNSVKAISAALGLQGGVSFLRAWQGITTHMYTMTKLNIGMNIFGSVFEATGLTDWAEKFFGQMEDGNIAARLFASVGKAVFVETAQADSIIDVNMGNNLQFATIMYATMPFVQGVMSGMSGVIKGSYNIAPSAPITSANNAWNKVKAELQNQIKGLAEEQIKEQTFKFALVGVGVNPALAEYLVEYMDPAGGVNFTNSLYTNSIDYANFNTQTGRTNAESAMNTMFNAYGSSNVTATFNDNGTSLSINVGGTAVCTIDNITNTESLRNAMAAVGTIAQTTDFKNADATAALQSNVNTLFNTAGNVGFALSQLDGGYSVNSENLMLALTATAVQNEQYGQENFGFTQKVLDTYTVANNYNGFNNTSLLKEIIGKGTDLSYSGKVSILNLVSNYTDENGFFNQDKITASINSGNAQSVENLMQLSILNEYTTVTGISVNVSEIINNINAEKIATSPNISNAARMATVASLAQLGAFAVNTKRNVPAVSKVTAAILKNNNTEQISNNVEKIKADIQTILSAGNNTVSEMTTEDVQYLYANLEVLQNQASGRIDSINNLQQQIVDKIFNDKTIADSQKYQILSAMGVLTTNRILNSNAATSESTGKLLELIATGIASIDTKAISELSAEESALINKSFGNIISVLSSNNGNISEFENVQKNIALQIEQNTQDAQALDSLTKMLESNTLTEENIKTINALFEGAYALKTEYAKQRASVLIVSKIRDSLQMSHSFDNGIQANEGITDIYNQISKMKAGNILTSEASGLSGVKVTQEMINICNTETLYNQANEALKKYVPEWFNAEKGFNGFRTAQADAIKDILNGNNLALLATVGFGKSNVAVGAAYARGLEKNANMDIIVATEELLNQYTNGYIDGENKLGEYKDYLKEAGVTIYDMNDIADRAMNSGNYTELKEALFDSNGLRVWTGERYGFLNTQAESKFSTMDTELRQILTDFQNENDRLTIVDEVHKFMESQTSFIQSKGDDSTLYSKADKKRNSSLEEAYDIATQVFNEMNKQGSKYYGLSISGADNTGMITKELDATLTSVAKEKGIERTYIDSILKGKIESYCGSQKATVAVSEKGTKKVVPVAEGKIEMNRVFNDYAYAYGIAREAGLDNKAALEATPVSETDMGTSGSRLFYGKGQYVGMSGTLEHVLDMSSSFGMAVKTYGSMKDFELSETTKEKADIIAVNGKSKTVSMIDTDSLTRTKGDGSKDTVGFVSVSGLSQEAVRNSMIEQIADQIEYNLSRTQGKHNIARTQLIMSVDTKFQEQLKEELVKRGLGDRLTKGITVDSDSAEVMKMIDQKGKDGVNAKIIIASEKGATGLDYSGNYDLLVDATGAGSSLLTQTYGRVNRHDGEQCTRLVFTSETETAGLEKEYSDPMVIGDIYRQLSTSSLKSQNALAEKFFTLDADGKVIIKDTNNEILSFEMAKLYSLYKQSGQSLIFGLNDSIKDKFLTGKLTELIKEAGGQETKSGATVYNVLHDLLNKSQSSKLRVGETVETGISDGLTQMENSLGNLQTEALEAYKAIRTNLIAVNASQELIDKVNAEIAAWESVDGTIAEYKQNTVENAGKTNTRTTPITRVDTLKEAVQTMLSYSSKVVASYGNSNEIENAPETVTQISANIEKAGVNVSKEQVEDLSKLISSNPMMSVNGEITALGQQTINNYKEINIKLPNMKISDDDDLAKALAMLLMQLFGDKIFGAAADETSGDAGSMSKTNILNNSLSVAEKLASQNINIDDVITLMSQGLITEDNISSFAPEQLRQILTAEYEQNLAAIAKNGLPSAMYIKTIETIVDLNKKGANIELTDQQKDLLSKYNDLLLSYETQKYSALQLSAAERAKFANEEFKANHTVLAGVINETASVAGDVLKFLPISGIMSIFNGVLGVSSAGTLVDSLKQVVSVSAITPISNKLYSSSGTEKNDITGAAIKLSVLLTDIIAAKTVKKSTKEILEGISKDVEKMSSLTDNEGNILDSTTIVNNSAILYGKYIGDGIDADMNVLQWFGNDSDIAENFSVEDIDKLGVLNDIVNSAKEDPAGKLAKGLAKLDKAAVSSIVDSDDLSAALLSSLGYKKVAAQIKAAEKTAETEFIKTIESEFKPSASGLTDEQLKAEKEKFIANKVSEMSAEIKSAALESVVSGLDKQKLSESDVKAVKAILNLQNNTETEAADTTDNVIEFVKSCAQSAVEGFGVEYSADKTFGDYVLDTLKVAGIAETAVKVTEALLGTVRGNLGENYEYAMVNDASKIKTKVAAYYTNDKGEGHVATVDSEKALKAEEANGFTFTGIVIAEKGEIREENGLGTIYNKEALKKVMGKIDTSKLNAAEAGTAEEVMGEVVNGVTAPSELSKTLEYVLNIWSRDTGAMLEYIGLDKDTELSNSNKKAIVQAATDKMAEAIEMGKKGELSGAEVKTEIALVTTLRDLLITTIKEEKGEEWVAKAGAEEILTKLVISKAVNQNVIIAGMEKEKSGKADEFVIDIQKLQKAISDKNIVFAKDAKIDDVMDMLKDKKTDKYRTPMMRLSDIKAVAAAA
ncbi:MAG: hypothetical protein AB7E39_01350 [Endomicrobiaceae bacterium]